MSDDSHVRLVLPGPVEVRQEILEAQSEWMIGHRTAAFVDLYGRLHENLKRAFFTESRVYMSTSSGTGLWEAASRNLVRDEGRILHLVGGAFAERWAEVSHANGKQVDLVEVEWGKAILPEMVHEALRGQSYDAVAVVHNESSTGVLNPVAAIAAVVNEFDDTLMLVDTVSGFAGAEIRVDAWGLDMVLTSTQKALALPPGMAFGAVSDRALARAEKVPNRGYYFDLLTLEKSALKNNTPSTPAISLMYAADKQLEAIMEEGMENRWLRHTAMKERVSGWALEHGFELYAQEGYRSPTLTAISNTREIDVPAMRAFMLERGFAMDGGYGPLKGKTFRIPHMGDMTQGVLSEVLALLDEFLEG